jgi:hypothetical protein
MKTTILRGGDVASGGAFRAQKRCEPKPLCAALKSHAQLMSYPISMGGRPIFVFPCSNSKEGSSNK